MTRFRRTSLLCIVAALCVSAGSLFAQGASAIVTPPPPPPIWLMTWQAGALMLAILFGGFYAMTRYNVRLPLAMSLVSCTFLVLQWTSAPMILRSGFEHYAAITVLFTAVAIPAHMIERSQGFKWVAASLGNKLGRIRLRNPSLTTPLLVVILIVMTYVTAALMHNVTSILIMTPVIIRLCASYRIPSRWILSAALIASNLGGFSTRWGDTPNIIESHTWGLQAGDFFREVMPANLIVLLALILLASLLTQRSISAREKAGHPSIIANMTLEVARTAADWHKARTDLAIDRRLLTIGVGLLTSFIVLHVIFPTLDIALGALTIVLAILLERKDRKSVV